MDHTTDVDRPYRDAWRHFWRWYIASLCMFVGFLPVFASIGLAFPSVIANGGLIFALFAIYGITWVAVTNVARRWPCPRCGEYFFGSMWLPQLPMLFVRTCRSCGLPRNAPSDPDAPTMSVT
jgi:hypothetical protein